MKAAGQQSALANELGAARASDAGRRPLEQSAAATSGTYFRATRPSEEEAAPPARGDSGVDAAKLEGLRFELDVGAWRADSERIAQCVIADAECVTDEDEE